MGMTDTLKVFCDGSITGGHWANKEEKLRGSLPHAWAGWWVRHEGTGHVVQFRSLDLGEGAHMSANVAEYFAVRSVLNWILESKWGNQPVIWLFSDSQVVINQITGRNNCYDSKLMLLRDSVHKLARQFPYVKFQWIPREQNKEADVLSKGLQLFDQQPTWRQVQDIVNGKLKVKKLVRQRRAAAEKGSGSSSPPSE